ncbi:hypothetical protein CEXT_410931 [Caerostris extrusa]|uniref:Uncharacterized protein n=1 Tax=Caerostris extrusa TaxID=172846 RepID=A0AAV4MDA9_CAEEX|nr:hypothetical protein CEXT_410931 [Caerostris extrusa]
MEREIAIGWQKEGTSNDRSFPGDVRKLETLRMAFAAVAEFLCFLAGFNSFQCFQILRLQMAQLMRSGSVRIFL